MGGTGTGNPLSAVNGDPPPSDSLVSETETGNILKAMCTQVSTCFPGVQVNTCIGKLLASEVIPVRLGSTETGSWATYLLISHEARGLVIPRRESAQRCRSEILDLRCEDARVQKSYVEGAPNPFAETPELIGEVCRGVFAP
jgi:hypothetical protein